MISKKVLKITADEAREAATAAIPIFAKDKIEKIFPQIEHQMNYGGFTLAVVITDVETLVKREVIQQLTELGYKVVDFETPGCLNISWYPPDSGD